MYTGGEKLGIFKSAPHESDSDDGDELPAGGAQADGPCAKYALDMNAARFGACKHCGYPKSEHVAAIASPAACLGADRAASFSHAIATGSTKSAAAPAPNRPMRAMSAVVQAPPGSSVGAAALVNHEQTRVMLQSRSPIKETSPVPCDDFHLDMTAAKFGACRCGFLKADHQVRNMPAAPLRKPSPQPATATSMASSSMRAASVQPASGCAASPGVATAAASSACPAVPTASHESSRAAVLASSGGTATVRVGTTPATPAPCSQSPANPSRPSPPEAATSGVCDVYQLDMTAARFGDCKCGYSKAEHKLLSSGVTRSRSLHTPTGQLLAGSVCSPPITGSISARAASFTQIKMRTPSDHPPRPLAPATKSPVAEDVSKRDTITPKGVKDAPSTDETRPPTLERFDSLGKPRGPSRRRAKSMGHSQVALSASEDPSLSSEAWAPSPPGAVPVLAQKEATVRSQSVEGSVAHGDSNQQRLQFGDEVSAKPKPSAASSGGLFRTEVSGKPKSSAASSGGLFGDEVSAKPKSSAASSGGLFGDEASGKPKSSSASNGGLFGGEVSATPKSSLASSGGLFGDESHANPKASGALTGGLFGAAAKKGLFDNADVAEALPKSKRIAARPTGKGLFD